MNTRSELWAKYPERTDPYPLICHLLDTATSAKALWRTWLRPGLRDLLTDKLGENAEDVISLICGLHDIGKASPVFQLQQASPKNNPWIPDLRDKLEELGYPHLEIRRTRADKPIIRRHEQVSAAHLAGNLRIANQQTTEHLATIVALGHHGTFSWDGTNARSFTSFANGEWENARNDLLSALESACGVRLGKIPQVDPVTTILLSGFVIVADRLASQQSTVDKAMQQIADGGLLATTGSEWIEQRLPYFEAQIEKLLGVYKGFENPQQEILGEYQPRGAQTLVDKAGDGLWMIMTATGSGKTEAFMLRHSQANESLTLLLPTQATTNAQMRRSQRMFSNTGNVAALAHGDAWLEDFYNQNPSASTNDNEANRGTGGLFPTEFVASRAQRLLAPVTVATVDQALMASLPIKWTHLRLLALANSHVVIDEVHTMDEYQMRLLEPLLWWLGRTKTRVSVLSATLTTRHRDLLVRAYSDGQKSVGYPATFPSVLSVGLSLDEAPKTIELEMDEYTISLDLVESDDLVANHIQWATEMLNSNPQARLGIVVNTIDRAQQIAKTLQSNGVDVIVLHSRMSLKHRQDSARKLEELLGRNGAGQGLIVVGTQAIEASLDIDLDCMSTDLAPASSIIQRAGRVWRHDDPRRCTRLSGYPHLPLRIVRSTKKSDSLPYFSAELKRTWGYLEGKESLSVPEDVQEFIEVGTPNLDEIEPEAAELEDMYAEVAGRSLKSSKGSQASINLAGVLDSDSTIGDLNALTLFSEKSRDSDEDFPSTRYRENVSQRILVTGPGAENIPGGWTESLEDLLQIDKHDRASIKRALAGVITVGQAMIGGVNETMNPVSDVAGLQGIIAGPLPPEYKYDPKVGLIKE